MSQSSNRESSKVKKWSETHRAHVPCVACGAKARAHAANLPFCNACLDRTSASDLPEWDELGTGD